MSDTYRPLQMDEELFMAFLLVFGGDMDMFMVFLMWKCFRYHENRGYRAFGSRNSLLESYYNGTDREFRRTFGFNQMEFQRIVEELSCYFDRFSDKALPYDLQVAIYLNRFVSRSSTVELSLKFGVSEGSIINCSNRVSDAIIEILKPSTVGWPNRDQKAKIKEEFFKNYGIDDVIGVIDGSHIPLFEAPKVDRDVYVSRKKRFGLQIQAICDHRLLVYDYEIGWPASVHDARVFENSSAFKNRRELFNGSERILADSAYPILPSVLPPYKNATESWQRAFNYILSSARVLAEHTFACIKGRFRQLKELRCTDLKNAVKYIESLIILHNFAIQMQFEDALTDSDTDSDTSDSDSEYDDDDDVYFSSARRTEKEMGIYLREMQMIRLLRNNQ